jgi:chorismate mutase
MDTLAKLRTGIDAIDAQLVALLAQRFALTDEVGLYKKQHQLPATDAAREAAQMARIAELAQQHGLDTALAQKFLRVVIDEVVSRHKQL